VKLELHVYFHSDDKLLAELDSIRQFLQLFKDSTMTALTDLQAAVAAESTAVASAVTLLGGLKAALDAAIASGDPAALQQLSNDIGAQTKALADAVAANTPAPTAGVTPAA
jgi:hypothetical protein